MKITKEEFVKLVREEIETIKEKATDEEKGRLDFENFDEDDRVKCIYGQMTGDFLSERAIEIMPKSLEFISKMLFFVFEGIMYTYLEDYLLKVKSDTHKNIIEYIKGEADELILPL